ncbi:class I SAM-dependent methyltransferase [Priestia abyssalis]|uniref:class I SAM-dependent methyltransferase n=1 Tax=Priestia abyssalis TaxID=1221450 RepID=UPI0009954E20|nr:class I SAM-dependent methyltransferase [Priestia abyssalis]
MSRINQDTFFGIFGNGHFRYVYGMMGPNDLEPILAFSRTFYPKVVVEIGISHGGTAKCILENSPWIERYIGIDVVPNYKTSLSIQQAEVPEIAGAAVKNDPRVELIIKPNGSRDLNATELPIADLILIDGDHSSEGVLNDTHLARKIIRKGGIICWHDYGNSAVPGVKEVIDNLNIKEGNHICHIENSLICFQICREGR